jgi:hypothetical protein
VVDIADVLTSLVLRKRSSNVHLQGLERYGVKIVTLYALGNDRKRK